MSELSPYGIQYKEFPLAEQKSINLMVEVADAIDSHDREMIHNLLTICRNSTNKNKLYLIRILAEALDDDSGW